WWCVRQSPAPCGRSASPARRRSSIMNTGGIVALIVVVVLIVIVLSQTVRVVQQGYVGAVKRLGSFLAIREPGIAFIMPFADQLTRVDIRETPRTGDRQEVITRDNVNVAVNATIFSQVIDARAALFSVSNYGIAIEQLARTTLRAVFGSI